MQERGGENNSPPAVMLLGQADPGPALLFFSFSGPDGFWPRNMLLGQTDSGPAKKRKSCWAEIGPTPFGAESGPVSWAGPAHLIYYIIYYNVFILFIYIWIYI